MTTANVLQKLPLSTAALAKSALIGAGIGLAIISIFVFGVDRPNPAWGTYWQIKPLLLTPCASAAGAVFFYLVNNLQLTGYLKAFALVAGILGFVVILWVGVVLGLNGTMWD
ncbi:MAG: potassium transporter KefB [Bacteroidota bacterium]